MLSMFTRRRGASAPGFSVHPFVSIADTAVTSDGLTLLRPVTLGLDKGQILSVRGQNGSGKSTLLRVLAGVIPCTSGTVTIAGRTVDDRDPLHRSCVSSMIGLPPFASELTVQEHLMFIAATWVSRQESEARVSRAITRFALTSLVNRYPHELSSGQTQLLALAMAFIRPSRLLLLDEPEQRLDAGHRGLVADALRNYRERGGAVVFATHSAELSDELSDKSITLRADGDESAS